MSKSALIELYRADQATYVGRKAGLGPSSLATECDKCVARALENALQGKVKGEEDNPYWFGAFFGTAVHGHAEELSKKFENSAEVLAEFKLPLYTVAGYGEVRGVIDRFEIADGRIRDFKGGVRKDKKPLSDTYDRMMQPYEGEPVSHKKYRHKMRNYYYQCHMYGPALERLGYVVNEVTLEFFLRDGSGDADILVFDFDYNPALAKALWDRVDEIAANLDGEWSSHSECYPCAIQG